MYMFYNDVCACCTMMYEHDVQILVDPWTEPDCCSLEYQLATKPQINQGRYIIQLFKNNQIIINCVNFINNFLVLNK